MSSKSSRTKGANAEREVTAILTEAGYECHRTPHSGALSWMKLDITGAPWPIEVKRCETTRIDEWHTKACEDAKGPAILIYRRSRQPWRCVLLLSDFLKLVER